MPTTRSRTIVSMSRYSETSCSSHTRPWPGTTIVPPSSFSPVTIRLISRLIGVDLALDAAAALQVDHRVAGLVEDIARSNDIRPAEHHHHVAVGVRGRLVQQLDRLVVDVHVLLRDKERRGRPRATGVGDDLAGRRAHPAEDVLVGDDDGALLDQFPRRNERPELVDRRVAARMLRIGVGIHDVADGFVGNHADGGHCPCAHRFRAGIYDEQALRSNLHGHVGAGPANHVDIARNLHDLDVTAERRRRAAR